MIIIQSLYIDRSIRRSDLIQKLLKEMAEAKEEEAPSQEMCIDQNGEHTCLLTLFPGRPSAKTRPGHDASMIVNYSSDHD